MKKVLIVTGTMNFGGIENQLMHLLRKADKEKFQIDFTSTMPDAYYRNEIEALGGKFYVIPKMSKKNPIPYCKALYEILKDGQYDIIHSHELFHSGIVLRIAAMAGVPGRFVHAHNWFEGDGSGKYSFGRRLYQNTMRKLIRRYSTCQIACSTLAGKFLYGEDILSKPSYHLVYNSVDTTKFLDAYDNKEDGEFCDDGWCNVLQVGRFSEVKNQLFTAEIAQELKKREKRIRILCAGNNGNDYEAEVRQAIQTMGIQEHMVLLGVRGDIDALMRKSAAFLLPSRYEGMPLVLIEAQASGLPCVVADTFSREVDFEIGTVRWLKLDGDVCAWTDAVESAVAQERAQKADIIKSVKEKGFDSRLFAQTLCRLYEESASK